MGKTLTVPVDLYIQLEATVKRRRLRSVEQLLEEWQSNEIDLHQPHSDTPITERIAAMYLPVFDWEQMEREIEAGRLE